jgi:hypothetical protein
MKLASRFLQNFLKIWKKLSILLILFLLILISYIFLYFNDSLWSGYVNEADGFAQTTKDYFHLLNSNDGLLIKLDVNNGVINGTITSNKICNSQPKLQFVFLKGHVSLINKSHAKVIVYNNVQGHQHDFAKLDLELSGGIPVEFGGKMLPAILTIQGVDGSISTHPNDNIRITKIYRTIEDMQSHGIMSTCNVKIKSDR